MRKTLFSIAGALLIGLVALAARPLFAAADDPDPACCCIVKDGKYLCTKTGGLLDRCCCEKSSAPASPPLRALRLSPARGSEPGTAREARPLIRMSAR